MRPFSINRDFYFFGTLLFVLCAAMELVLGVVHFKIGERVFYLPTFSVWFVVMVIVNILGLFVLLKYYQHKRYSITFKLGLVYVILLVCHFIVIYTMSSARLLEGLFRYTYPLVLISVLLYSISLIFSNAGRRPWLKTAGLFIFVLGSIQLLSYIWNVNTENVQVIIALQKVRSWNLLAESLLPIPFLLNFLSEKRKLEMKNGSAILSNVLKGFLLIAGIAVTTTSFVLINNSYRFSDNLNNRLERAKVLAQPFKARTHVGSQGVKIPYRLLKPVDYDPDKAYPLVIGLHHGGGHGTDNALQIESSPYAQMLSKNENRRNYPAFIFVPQCPPGFTWGGIPNQPDVATLVFEAVDELEKEFRIDEKRRYVIGLSMGGYGSWHFISVRPKMFAAAIPICGGGNPDLAQSIIDVPIWAFHGEKDRSVPVSLSRDMIKAIRDAGGNPQYTEFSSAGHDIWNQVNSTEGLLDWFFEQKLE